MKVISVVNHKGGVGKTTVTFNFGAELVHRRYKVLLIDFDMQGNLTKGAGIKNGDKLKDTIAHSMDLIIDGNTCEPGILNTGIENLDIVPCNVSMADTKLKLQLAMARELVLDKVIKNIKRKYDYDYILIDNAPTIELDFQNSLVASDEVLIVTNPDIFSTEGMASLLREYTKIRMYFNKENLKIAGILINNADGRTNFTRDMIKAVKTIWKDNMNVFDTIIPQSVRVKESQASHQPIRRYDKNNKVALGFSSFTDEYLSLQN